MVEASVYSLLYLWLTYVQVANMAVCSFGLSFS